MIHVYHARQLMRATFNQARMHGSVVLMKCTLFVGRDDLCLLPTRGDSVVHSTALNRAEYLVQSVPQATHRPHDRYRFRVELLK
jgi:hypothetical protein